MVFVADDLAAWLVGALADAGLKRLSTWVRGSDLDRALREAATAAVQLTAEELCPDGGEPAEKLTSLVNRAFVKALVPSALMEGHATLREALQAGIARQLASRGDLGPTGTRPPSAEALDAPVTLLAEKLTVHLLQEIVVRGARGGPLEPLASQLNHDVTHLDLQELRSTVGRLDADVREALARSAPPGEPRQLPRDPPFFAGRVSEMNWLYSRCQPTLEGNGSRVLVISGLPGAGKTALCFHFAHLLAQDYFADAQLYEDLRGADQHPLTATDVLSGWLPALGASKDKIPEREAAYAAEYRTRLASKSALVVLDNAGSAAQVRPLLPGGRKCLVLVTSRHRLEGLEGAQHLSLAEMEPESAATLLRHFADEEQTPTEQTPTEQASLLELARLCGHLPLALQIAGGRLRGRRWSAAKFVVRLSDERRRLEELRLTDDLEVRAAFALSYEQLGEDEKRLFRRLPILGNGDFSTEGAAVLIAPESEVDEIKTEFNKSRMGFRDREKTAVPPTAYSIDDDLHFSCDEADELLGRLIDAQLLQPRAEDSYRLHDLLRLFAVERFENEEEASRFSELSARVLLRREIRLHIGRKGAEETFAWYASLPPVPLASQISPMQAALAQLRVAETAEPQRPRIAPDDRSASDSQVPKPPQARLRTHQAEISDRDPVE